MDIRNLSQALVDATPPEERAGALEAVRQALQSLRGAVPPPAPPASTKSFLSPASAEDNDFDR